MAGMFTVSYLVVAYILRQDEGWYMIAYDNIKTNDTGCFDFLSRIFERFFTLPLFADNSSTKSAVV